MASTLHAVSIDALDPAAVGRFWAELLGRELVDDEREGAVVLAASAPGELRLRFRPSAVPKTVQNRMHPNLTSDSPAHQEQLVARTLALGGRHVDVGQRGDEGHVVLGDVEGNEFCVVEPGNRFLAGCGAVGDVAGDGTHDVGLFWAAALGWPLVWDEGEETAVQSPLGGTKLTWGGPPLMPRPASGRDPWHHDLAVAAGVDVEVEVDRLVGLGATRLPDRPADGAWVVLADPDGNAFCLLP